MTAWQACYDNPATGLVEYHALAYAGDSHRAAYAEAKRQHPELWLRGVEQVDSAAGLPEVDDDDELATYGYVEGR